MFMQVVHNSTKVCLVVLLVSAVGVGDATAFPNKIFWANLVRFEQILSK